NQQQFPISSSSQQQLRKRNNNNNANFSSLGQEESAARDFINVLDHEASRFIKMVSLARWNCGTNMSEATQAKLVQAEAQSSHGLAQVLNLLRDSFGSSGAYANWKNYEDPFLVRLIWKSAKQNSIQDRHGPKASKSPAGGGFVTSVPAVYVCVFSRVVVSLLLLALHPSPPSRVTRILPNHTGVCWWCMAPRSRRLQSSPSDLHRVKGCTKVTAHHLKTAHQLLTQIAYDSSNTHLPRVFRTPPFPGFVEALGGAITLSLDSVKHLEAVDLAKKNSEGDSSASMRHGADINFLLAKALGILASMPFALTTERWRWDVWQNRVPKEKMNSHWWRLRREVQGVAAPNDRSDSLHLDPVGIPEVAGHQPIISQFLSSVLQFQFYEAMCQAAGQYKPNSPGKQRLHHCNLYNNKRAGEILKSIMRSGSSVHWKTLLHRTTGFSTFSLQPLLRYFAPLDAYLDKFLQHKSQCIGWGDECRLDTAEAVKREPKISTLSPSGETNTTDSPILSTIPAVVCDDDHDYHDDDDDESTIIPAKNAAATTDIPDFTLQKILRDSDSELFTTIKWNKPDSLGTSAERCSTTTLASKATTASKKSSSSSTVSSAQVTTSTECAKTKPSKTTTISSTTPYLDTISTASSRYTNKINKSSRRSTSPNTIPITTTRTTRPTPSSSSTIISSSSLMRGMKIRKYKSTTTTTTTATHPNTIMWRPAADTLAAGKRKTTTEAYAEFQPPATLSAQETSAAAGDVTTDDSSAAAAATSQQSFLLLDSADAPHHEPFFNVDVDEEKGSLLFPVTDHVEFDHLDSPFEPFKDSESLWDPEEFGPWPNNDEANETTTTNKQKDRPEFSSSSSVPPASLTKKTAAHLNNDTEEENVTLKKPGKRPSLPPSSSHLRRKVVKLVAGKPSRYYLIKKVKTGKIGNRTNELDNHDTSSSATINKNNKTNTSNSVNHDADDDDDDDIVDLNSKEIGKDSNQTSKTTTTVPITAIKGKGRVNNNITNISKRPVMIDSTSASLTSTNKSETTSNNKNNNDKKKAADKLKNNRIIARKSKSSNMQNMFEKEDQNDVYDKLPVSVY
ncbi:unnamed protein product, partial [Notodromas monacha]